MTILWSNNASTTVAGSITATDTTVNLAAGTGILFPAPIAGQGNYFVATFYDQTTKTQNEIVHCTAITGDTVTIIRGQEGTTPQPWTSGDIFANLVTAGTLEAFVQAGPKAADTTIVYTGIDVSTNPAHIVCNTVPVPAAYNTGMVFTIKVGTMWPSGTVANTGPIDLALNGVPAVFAKRTDGSDLIGGNLISNQEYLFMYNGQFFSTTFPPIPQAPPQYTFYVRSTSNSILDANGIESNSGFANTDTSAFKTIQGAINTIKNRYISALEITIRVADGTYTSGFADNTQYIAAWNIIGNTTNPGNVQIIASSTNPATYVPFAPVGFCVGTGTVSVMTVQGMAFSSYYSNCITDGVLQLSNCHMTAPSTGTAPTGYACCDCAGMMGISGVNCQYSGSNPQGTFCSVNSGGVFAFAYYDPQNTIPLTMAIVGSPTIDIWASAGSGGTISVYDIACSFPGGTNVQGYQFLVGDAGGIGFWSANINALPGNTAGLVVGSDATTLGGWLTHG